MSASPGPDPRRARVRRFTGIALTLVLGGLAIAVLVTAVTPRGNTTVIAPSDGAADVVDTGSSGAIYVHILGQVASPGLYELREGSRAVDAVAAAGGFTAQADAAAINLARYLSDGEQILVPALGETSLGAASGLAADGRVNLNTADEAVLDTLPGVGPATAAEIIAWRERNGGFHSVEDLLDVPGIGQSKLEAMRDLVTV